MALHFTSEEFGSRMGRLKAVMAERELDALLLFAQESMYWLSGYDTFGFAFFQCLVVKSDGEMVLLTRSADLRQARHTSIIENIVLWVDRGTAEPSSDLHDLLSELDLVGTRIGVEYDTAGLTAKMGRAVDEKLNGFARLEDASGLVSSLRATKSPAELDYVRKAGELSDFALDAAISKTKAGANEGDILAAMHSEIFSRGGDYPANEFIIGSGPDALLCRYKSGRRMLEANDQLTLEWSGVWAHYHAAMMRTLITGKPTKRHEELYEACANALAAVKEKMQVGNSFADMFDAHAKAFDEAGLIRHRLNACGYSLGATFTPIWMDYPQIYAGNDTLIEEAMVLFVHMIVFDSDTQTAMTIGQSFITNATGPEDLSRHDVDLIVCK